MGLSDPFSTTYEGAYKSGLSLGQGIDSAAGSFADTIAKKNEERKKEAQKNEFLKMIGMINDSEAAKTEEVPLTTEEYNKQAEDIIRQHADQAFGVKGVQLTGSSNPEERRKQYAAMLDPIGLSPKPKLVHKIDANKISSKYELKANVDSEGRTSYSFGTKSVDPMAEALKEQTAEDRKTRLKMQQDKIDSDLTDKVSRQVNPMVAPRGSQLGKIGETTVRAKRALDLLEDKNFKITSQVLGGIGSDMAGILQGGAPTVVGMSEQDYATLQRTISKASQYLEQHPEDALPEDMRDYLIDTFKRLNETNKYYIKQNLKTVEDAHKDWVKRNKDSWGNTKDDIYDTYGLSDQGTEKMIKSTGLKSQSSSDYQKYMSVIGGR